MVGQTAVRTRSEALIRSVSSVAFGVGGDGAFGRAVRVAAEWMRRRNPAIPHDAEDGAPFDVGGGGAPPARAVVLDIDEGSIWSAALDDPDTTVLGRTWITEITVAQRRGEVHFGTRLLNVTRQADEGFTPSLPGVVRNMIRDLACLADGEILRENPSVIETPDQLDHFYDLLERPDRRLPVIVLAEGMTREPYVALDVLTRKLAGAAHVYGMSNDCTWQLTRRAGRELSVFDGAVRMYRPGLRLDEADPYEHPLWLPAPERSPGDGAPIVARVLTSGVAKGTSDYPRFDAVRQAAVARSIAARRADTSDVDMAHLFEEENRTLREQLDELRTEQNQWLADAERERSDAERQIAELKAEIHRHRSQNELLRDAVRSGGERQQREPLDDFSHFGTWAERNVSPNIWFAPKAIKEAERNGQYREPERLGEAIYALDELYVPMRRAPDQDRREAWLRRMEELGLTLTPCFTREGDLQRFAEYSVSYRGEKLWCDLHLKQGGGTDPRAMFRIYVHWHEAEGVLVVGHLPSHLDNNMTN